MPGLELPGRRIEYLDEGRGEPVVLLHGSGASGAQWCSLVERLAPRFRVLAPDLYGCGRIQGRDGAGPPRLGHEAAVVHALLDALEGRPAHLVGHSHGGAVALHVARPRAARLRSLTVIEPVAASLPHPLSAEDGADATALREILEVADAAAQALAAANLPTLVIRGGVSRNETEALVVRHIEAHARRPVQAPG
jgi:pimeloyl-ACP methyl ester carboxylesterase